MTAPAPTRTRRSPVSRAAALLLAAGLVGPPVLQSTPARADVGLSAALTSDFRVRGLSFSDRQPALSLNLSYDHPSGAYFGASLIGANTARHGLQALGYQAYVGYAARISPSVSWDVGVTNADLTSYVRRRYRSNYTEVYGGVSVRDVSVHLYYSPDYLGEGVDTIYADIDGSIRPAPNWRLFAHIGLLTPLNRRAAPNLDRPQYDLRAGVATRIKSVELQLAWTRTGPDAYYPVGYAQAQDALVVGATYYF